MQAVSFANALELLWWVYSDPPASIVTQGAEVGKYTRSLRTKGSLTEGTVINNTPACGRLVGMCPRGITRTLGMAPLARALGLTQSGSRELQPTVRCPADAHLLIPIE
jgi:hypothetical protein